MNAIDNHDDRMLLVVDDNFPHRPRLARAMRRRDLEVSTADAAAAGIDGVRRHVPAYAVLDLKLEDGNGLDAVAAERPDSRIAMLTGYADIATAVAAVKAGAADYRAKPTDADAVETALLATGSALPSSLPELPLSAERARRERILRVYERRSRNLSKAARRLSLHRRTLQRVMAKRAPRETGDA